MYIRSGRTTRRQIPATPGLRSYVVAVSFDYTIAWILLKLNNLIQVEPIGGARLNRTLWKFYCLYYVYCLTSKLYLLCRCVHVCELKWNKSYVCYQIRNVFFYVLRQNFSTSLTNSLCRMRAWFEWDVPGSIPTMDHCRIMYFPIWLKTGLLQCFGVTSYQAI